MYKSKLWVVILFFLLVLQISIPGITINSASAQGYAFALTSVSPSTTTLGNSVRIDGTLCPNPQSGVITYVHYTRPDGSTVTNFSVHNQQDFCSSFTVDFYKPDQPGRWIMYAVAYGQGNQVLAQSSSLSFNVQGSGLSITVPPSRSVTPNLIIGPQASIIKSPLFSTPGIIQMLPDPPTSLIARTVATTAINLSWVQPAYAGASPLIGYKIQYDIGSGWTTLSDNTKSLSTLASANDLLPDTKYGFRIFAINSNGPSQPSNEASAVTSFQQRPCPTGQALNADGICTPIVCPTGQALNSNGICTPIVCPTGQALNSNGICTPIVCPTGQALNSNGICTPITPPPPWYENPAIIVPIIVVIISAIVGPIIVSRFKKSSS